MELSTRTTRRDGVTFVSLVVENPYDEAARFRVANELDGPIWPPRRNGRPEEGWDPNGYEGAVGAGGDVALGYATPAPPAESPAAIQWSEPAEESTDRGSPERVARTYADPRPPRDVLSPVASPGQQPAVDIGWTEGDPVGGEQGERIARTAPQSDSGGSS